MYLPLQHKQVMSNQYNFQLSQEAKQRNGANKGACKEKLRCILLWHPWVIDCLHLCCVWDDSMAFEHSFANLQSYVPKDQRCIFWDHDSTTISSNYINPENYATIKCNGTIVAASEDPIPITKARVTLSQKQSRINIAWIISRRKQMI